VLELNPLAAIMENVPGIENQKFGCITANLQAVLAETFGGLRLPNSFQEEEHYFFIQVEPECIKLWGSPS
jgi:hypothetical protein